MRFRHLRRALSEVVEYFTMSSSAYLNSRKASMLERSMDLKDRYKGERIFLFFTGTSIKGVDLSLFRGEYSMTMNYFVIHPRFEDLDVDFYCVAAPWNVKESTQFAWFMNIIYAKTRPDARIFLHASARDWIVNVPGYNPENTYYVSTVGKGFPDYCEIESFKGVFTCCVSLAVHMGFGEIYLVGADYAKRPHVIGHFYDGERSIGEPGSELLRMHSLIDGYARGRGVRIINVVEEGCESPVFESVSLGEVARSLRGSASEMSCQGGGIQNYGYQAGGPPGKAFL